MAANLRFSEERCFCRGVTTAPKTNWNKNAGGVADEPDFREKKIGVLFGPLLLYWEVTTHLLSSEEEFPNYKIGNEYRGVSE